MPDRLNLVTGATGFTGLYLLRELLDRGERVLGTDLSGQLDAVRSSEVPPGIGLDLDHPDLELVPSNLLEPDSLHALFERPVTHVFHPASLYDYSAPMEALRAVNVEGTRNLLEALRNAELERFVHWSTCGVFGKPYTAADGEKVNLPFNERSSSPKNTPPEAEEPEGTHLVNDYSITKWEQEKLMWKAHREDGLPLTVVRPAPIYGPGSAYGHGGIILGIAQGLQSFVPKDAHNYVTTSVHVSDVAGFAVYIAEREEGLGEDYNIVDNSIVSQYDFLHYIALLTGRSLREIPFLTAPFMKRTLQKVMAVWFWAEERFGVARPRVLEEQSLHYMGSSYWLSNRKTLEAGYDYRYPDVREGLKDTIAWFRETGWLLDPDKVWTVSPEGSKPSGTEED